jgi:hypothetical protein
VSSPDCPNIIFRDFRQRLREAFECRWRRLPVISDRQVGIFERTHDGKTYDIIVKFNDDESVTPTEVQAICEALQVDPGNFGFDLGD